MNLSEIINYDLYPLHQPTSIQYKNLVKFRQEQLATEGISCFENFIHPDALELLVEQSKSLIGHAFHNVLTGNAYLTEINSDWEASDPRRMTDSTSLGAVAGDDIPKTHLLRQIYESSSVLSFVQAVVGRGEIYRYDCPLGELNLAVMKKDDYLRWHFDQSDFVVSLCIQNAVSGGRFEFVRNLRSRENPNFLGVKAVLEGKQNSQVKDVTSPPGTLVLFEGMNTIHRVSTVEGDVPRLMGLFGYADKPGVKSSDYLKRIRYGRQ